jgi:hypothetical protein
MNYLDLILRWLHIYSVIALVGGIFFWRFVWYPATCMLAENEREDVAAAMRRPWSRIVAVSSGLLFVTGLVNAVRIIQRYEFPSETYHVLVGVKLVLALAVFYISAVLAGRSSTAQRFRQNASFWLTLNTLLAVLLVGIGGFMKMTDRTLKPSDAAPRDVVAAAQPADMELLIGS